MSYKDITEGDYVAKPVAARFVEAKTGTIGIEVAFNFLVGEQKERLYWIGWLGSKRSEKDDMTNTDRTMKVLVDVLGFNGDDSVDENGVLTSKEALAWENDVKIVVGMEANPETGIEYPRIKFVNRLGGSGFGGLAGTSVKAELGALGFKAAFLSAKQSSGAPAPKKAAEPEPKVRGFGEPARLEEDARELGLSEQPKKKLPF
jgi:hypothetical protein